MRRSAAPALLALALLMRGEAQAEAQVEIFNTGASPTGVLAGGAIDPNWFVVELNRNARVLSEGNIPGFAWIPNSTSSKWISTEDSSNPGTGIFTYRTTFNLAGFNLTTAFLRGRWTADNTGFGVFLNGQQVGAGFGSSEFNQWHDFTASSGFQAGVNTLDFQMRGEGGWEGVRVDALSVQASALPQNSTVTPEPISMALLGTGLAGVAAVRRRRRKDEEAV